MWKGRTGEKSKPLIWPGDLMPSIDAIEVILDHSKSYMAHMTLFCMTNMCGNLETKRSLIVYIAHMIGILVLRGDPYRTW